MSYLQALLVADARRAGRAQRSASVRHRRLTRRPLAILPWQLGAEPFTAAAVAWGFEPGTPRLAVPGEPRDRELAFRALTLLARDFNRWFEGPEREEPPQVVVANRGALGLLGRLGRRLAYLPTDGERPADPELVRFGRHLRFLFDRARFPGQQLLVVLTDLLSSHWTSELSDLETQSLPALASTIDPPAGKLAHEAAFDAESVEIGPLPTGRDDHRVDALIARFNESRGRNTDEAVVAPLRKPIEEHYAHLVHRGWDLIWRCLDRERLYPEALHVTRRWEEDKAALDRHIDWVTVRGLPYRTRQTSEQAARTLRGWEEAQRLLEAEEAIDDPLRMIPTLLANQGLAGVVTRVDREHFEPGAKRRVRRPLLEIQTEERCALPAGKRLWWTRTPGKTEYVLLDAQPLSGGGSQVMLQLETSADQELPVPGTVAIFSRHHTKGDPPLTLPESAPWTHVEPDITPSPIEGPADEGSWE